MERRGVPRELGQRAGGVLRPGRGRQHLLQHQRPELPSSRASRPRCRAGHRPGSRCRARRPGTSSEQTNSPVLIDNNPGAAPTSASRSPTPATPSAATACRSPTPSARLVPRAPTRRRSSSACARATNGHSQATRPLCRSARPTAAIPSRRPAPIPPLAQAAASAPAGCASRTRLTPPTMPPSGSRRMPGTCNLYGENLSNSNASVFVSTDQFIVAQTPLRPRVLGRDLRLQVLRRWRRSAAHRRRRMARPRRGRSRAARTGCRNALLSFAVMPQPEPMNQPSAVEREVGRIASSCDSGASRSSLQASSRAAATVPENRDVLYLRAQAQRLLRRRAGSARHARPTRARCTRGFSRLYQERGHCHVVLREAPRGDRGLPARGEPQPAAAGELGHARRPVSHDRRRRERRHGGGARRHPQAVARRRS